MSGYSTDISAASTASKHLHAGQANPHRFAGWKLAVLEAATIISLLIGCQAAYSGLFWGQVGNLDIAGGTGLILAALYGLIAHARHLYSSARILSFRTSLPDVAAAWVLACLIAALSAFLLKIGDQASRGAALGAAGGAFLALSVMRVATASALRSGLALGTVKRINAFVLVDGTLPPDAVLETLRQQGYRVVRCVFVGSESGRNAGQIITDIQALVRARQIDEVFVTTSLSHLVRLDSLGLQLKRLSIPARLIAPPEIQHLIGRPVDICGDFKMIEMQRPALMAHERAIKRLLDIFGSGVAIACLWPVFLMIALAIKLDSPGPVIFRQDRVGSDGKVFRILKFRSMRTMDNGAEVRQATRGDPRITAVGRWIRSTSLDELPQLFNVLFGDMSLVGPRPHVVAHDSHYTALIADYPLRHHMKPGITGLAQVTGFRGETPTQDLMEQRVRHDLSYIENWSLWLDLSILIRTVFVVTNVSKTY